MGLPSLLPHSPQRERVYPACYPTHPNDGSTQPATPLTPTMGLPSLLPHSPQRWVYPACYSTHPNDGLLAGVADLGKLGLVALLTEDALLLEDEHGVLQLLLTAGADKVLRVPAPTHGRRIRAPGGGEERRGMRVRRGGIKGRERECTWQLYRATTEEVP